MPRLDQIRHYPEVRQWNLSVAQRDIMEHGYLMGHADGAAAARAEIARLNWQVDLWYFCANNKGKRPNDYYTHQTDELWRKASA